MFRHGGARHITPVNNLLFSLTAFRYFNDCVKGRLCYIHYAHQTPISDGISSQSELKKKMNKMPAIKTIKYLETHFRFHPKSLVSTLSYQQ